jgi:hypothetical protein
VVCLQQRLFTKPRPTSTLCANTPIAFDIVVRQCKIAIAITVMPRTTRAAAKAEAVHEDNTAATTEEAAMNMSTRSQRNREPLRPLTPNSVDSVDTEKPADQNMAGKTKGKKKAKGGKKNKKTKTRADEENVNHQGMEVDGDGDEINFIDPPESEHGLDNAKGMLRGDVGPLGVGRSYMTRSRTFRLTRNSKRKHSDISSVKSIPTERPASPSVKAGRRTRRQSQEPKVKTSKMHVIHAPDDGDVAKQTCSKVQQSQHAKELDHEPEVTMATKLDFIDSSSKGDTMTGQCEPPKEELHLKNNVQSTISLRPSACQSPVDPTATMNALEDELEEVVKNLPNLDAPDSPTKPMPPSATVDSKFMPASEKTPTRKLSSNKAKGTAANKSMLGRSASVRTVPTNKLTKTTQSSTLSRSNSVKSGSTGLTNTKTTSSVSRLNSTRPRLSSVSVPPKDDTATKDTKTTDYLATRRRPISMQFPTPPPPTKSAKPPTKPTFTLPGDAITAKLKAAREDRLKREEEETQKRREFKARPIPGSVKNKPTAAVKQTAASRARQSIIGSENSKDGKEDTSAAVALGIKPKQPTTTMTGAGLKRSSTVTAATTSTKRTSTMPNTKPPSMAGSKPNPTHAEAAPKRPTTLSRSSSVSLPKNTSTTVSRNPSRTMTATDVALQRQKARAIFNRDKVEKEARERERREKEDAAKRARAEAAERGRLASREWAERQRKKGLGGEGVAEGGGE